MVPNVLLSTPQALRLPLRWIAILSKRLNLSLAATSGIHSSDDVIKMLLVGANVTMMCSALYKNGIGHIKNVLADVTSWLSEREYESLQQMQGSMSQASAANPAAFERANYMKALRTYRG